MEDQLHLLNLKMAAWSREFDHIFHIVNADAALQSVARQHNSTSDVSDFIQTAGPHIKTIIVEALGRRAVKVEMTYGPLPDSKTPSSPIALTFGVVLSKHDFKDTLDRGPEANTAAASKFRQFWGDAASKLRRFPDGSMAEGVSWPATTESEKRMICGDIVRQALRRHAAIGKTSVVYVGNLWDDVLKLQRVKFPPQMPVRSPTAEEYFSQIKYLYDCLSEDLRKMADLPLNIVSIRSTSPVVRSTEVFPPIPAALSADKVQAERQPYLQTIPVQVVMEGSAKWPNERNAVARLKTAFQLKLMEHLKGLDYFVTVADVEALRVWKAGYCFTVEVVYLGEVPLSRKVVLPDGRLKLEDTPQFLILKEKFDLNPKLASAIGGVVGQDESFGTACRIAKRWISSQLLHHYVPDEAVELIMAQIYVRPQPLETPAVPDVAFLRFLSLIATHDWHKSPLIVDFKKDMTHAEIAAIKADFTDKRKSFPLMSIITHFDATSHWTRKGPSAVILKRLGLLAKVSLLTAEAGRLSGTAFDPKTIFRPPASDDWDCLIHLKPIIAARRHEALDLTDDVLAAFQTSTDHLDNSKKKLKPIKANKLPVLDLSHGNIAKPDNRLLLDFDAVNEYVAALRETFGELAYFFVDPHGGTVVTVVWKTAQFKTVVWDGEEECLTGGRMTEKEEKGKRRTALKLSPNIAAMVEDFRLLGKRFGLACSKFDRKSGKI
ncbi:Nucleolar protein 6 [Hypsibius exemplaris]|uniref:Nucleolar protein 6 n=1 Tax=Hypsibius exemplaris TaxID=2072580 RepID=A0A9X6NJT7_HYPEX|nr:Nucleolar protein 6 [Hypsibius exemplaris]